MGESKGAGASVNTASSPVAIPVAWRCTQCAHRWNPFVVHQQRVRCPVCGHQQRVRLPGIPDRRRKSFSPVQAPRVEHRGSAAPGRAKQVSATAVAVSRPRVVQVSGARQECAECGQPASLRMRLNHPRPDLPAALRSGQEHDVCARHARPVEITWMQLVGPLGSVWVTARYRSA